MKRLQVVLTIVLGVVALASTGFTGYVLLFNDDFDDDDLDEVDTLLEKWATVEHNVADADQTTVVKESLFSETVGNETGFEDYEQRPEFVLEWNGTQVVEVNPDYQTVVDESAESPETYNETVGTLLEGEPTTVLVSVEYMSGNPEFELASGERVFLIAEIDDEWQIVLGF